MGTAPIMSADTTRQLLALSSARTAVAQPASSGTVGLMLEAKQLDQARSQLRDGETVSYSA